MTTPQPWQPSHSEGHRALAEQVQRLRDQGGLDFTRIADELNSSGQLSPRGKSFYPALVYSIYRKWSRKLQREKRERVVRLTEVSMILDRQ